MCYTTKKSLNTILIIGCYKMAYKKFYADQGVQTGNVIISGTANTITGLATSGFPTNASDAATKSYVDSLTTGLLSNGTNSISVTNANITLNAGNSAVITVTQGGTVLAGNTTIQGVAATGGTGTGNLVFSASPTFTGTAAFAAINAASYQQTTFDSTTTSGGTTVLTAASNQLQQFTGSANHTLQLPDVSTLSLNTVFYVLNRSTGQITVKSSGGNTIGSVLTGTQVAFSVISTAGTTASSWYAMTDANVLSGGGGSSLLDGYTIGSVTPGAGTFTTLTATGSSSFTTTQLTALGVGTAPQTTGTIYATGNIYAGYSDIRLKTQTGTIDNALERIVSLSGILYTPNTLAQQFGFNDSAVQVGLVAQDVQKILPEAVSIAPFDIVDGKSKSGENYLTVNYERLVPLLIEAIKELKQEIDNLKNR